MSNIIYYLNIYNFRALNHFYLVFEKFINLKMYKMQIINTDLLLIKYGNVTVKNSKVLYIYNS